jgi:hypothetical protein
MLVSTSSVLVSCMQKDFQPLETRKSFAYGKPGNQIIICTQGDWQPDYMVYTGRLVTKYYHVHRVPSNQWILRIQGSKQQVSCIKDVWISVSHVLENCSQCILFIHNARNHRIARIKDAWQSESNMYAGRLAVTQYCLYLKPNKQYYIYRSPNIQGILCTQNVGQPNNLVWSAAGVMYTWRYQRDDLIYEGRLASPWNKLSKVVIYVNLFIHKYSFSYDLTIKATGRYFSDFLQNVDNIHMQMRFTYPKMKSPSMYITHVDPQGVVLVYRSTRQGFIRYFMGKYLTNSLFTFLLAYTTQPRYYWRFSDDLLGCAEEKVSPTFRIVTFFVPVIYPSRRIKH